MMDPRLTMLSFLVICSSFSPPPPVSAASPLQCVQKLIACQPYLKNPDNTPAWCCAPLKDMIANDPQCLCDVFNNPDLLKTMNVTQAEALQLPKACGATADVSICHKDGGVPTTSPTPPPPSAPSTNGTTPDNNTTTNSASSSNGKIVSGGAVGFVALLTALFV
uniref:Bifunctional inhibitor/plant lipid transfer protein/seed storage helical domain-containing protein n=1 Tax=Kalanchoe fedtschenkoi TaxID=63787 RepID=A0A7N0VA88_KALFE